MDSEKRRKLAALRGMMAAAACGGSSDAGVAPLVPDDAQAAGILPDGHEGCDEEASVAGRAAGPLQTSWEAYRRVVELCGYHDYCRAGLRDRLRREGVPDTAAEQGIAEAVRIGLVDDLRWGEMRASAMMRRGSGNDGIARELAANGIDVNDVRGWPLEFEERFGSERERAQAVLRKKPPRSKNPRASAYNRLVRKGYAADVARNAAEAWARDQAPDAF